MQRYAQDAECYPPENRVACPMWAIADSGGGLDADGCVIRSVIGCSRPKAEPTAEAAGRRIVDEAF